MMNDLPFELFIAFRYLLAKRKQAFIALISFISVIGVMVGVMAVLIALALMTGLQGEMRQRIVGASAHVYVSKFGDGISDIPAEVAKLKQVPRVTGVAPAVIGKGLLSAGDQRAAVTIKGVDPTLEPTVTNIRQSMKSGSLQAVRSGPEEMDGIVLGTDLATTLTVKEGDTVRLLTPDEVLTPMGMSPYRTRAFKVVGIFSLGLYEFDSEYALVDLPVAERVLRTDKPQFLQVRLDDMFASKAVAEDIEKRLGDQYVTQDWAAMNKSLFSALWLEKMAISITIALLAIVLGVTGTTLGVRAAQAPDLAPLVTKYWQAWEKGPDAAAPLYAKDAGLVFYDLEPVKYTGWGEYKAGVGPNILAKFQTVKFTVGNDVKTTVHGNVGWTTATVKGDGALKGGAPVHVVIRHTAIWEKRGADWLIVHEHVSVPSALPAPPAAK